MPLVLVTRAKVINTLVAMMSTRWRGIVPIVAVKLMPLLLKNQMSWVSMICRAMCGSGVKIGMENIVLKLR